MRSWRTADYYPVRLPLWTGWSLAGGLALVALNGHLCSSPAFQAECGPAALLLAAVSVVFFPRIAAVIDLPNGPRGFRIEEEALAEVQWNGVVVRHPWSSIRAIHARQDCAVILLSRVSIRVGPNVERGAELIDRIRRATGLAEGVNAAGRDAVDPAQIERWLGVEPGGALVCRGRIPWATVAGCIGSILAIAVYAETFLDDPHHSHPPTSFFLVAGALGQVALVCAWFSARGWPRETIRAQGDGLTIHQGRRWWSLGWTEILEIRRARPSPADRVYLTCVAAESDYDWLVETPAREYRFHHGLSGADRLAEAMRLVSAALAAGRAVPRLSDVPEGAISLARDGGEERAERGVSVAPPTQAPG